MFSNCTDTEYNPGSTSGPVHPEVQLCGMDPTYTVVLLGGTEGTAI